jgi:hypothetical protein
MAEKVCRKCQESWPDDNEFYKTEKDTMCIACQYERDRGYKRAKRERQKDPALREARLAEQRRQYAVKKLDPVWWEKEKLRSRRGRLNERLGI